MTHTKNGPSAAQRMFAEYTRYITAEFLEKYGASYVRCEDVRNTWRHTTKYSKEIELFLILKTKTFIRAMDPRDPNSTNLQFLDALTTRMADYLSAYGAKNPEVLKRKHAREKLKHELFHNSSYIAFLRAQQTKKQLAKKFEHGNKKARTNTPARKRTSPNMPNGILVVSMVFSAKKSK